MDNPSLGKIPLVDISPAIAGTKTNAREAAAREFSQACRLHGCVGITGHGIPKARLEEAFDMMKHFFNLPFEDKMKAPHPKDGAAPARGYSSPGMEKVYSKEAADSNDIEHILGEREKTDVKETFDIGSEEHIIHYNLWPPEEVLPNFRSFMTTFFWQLQQASNDIMDILLLGHGVSEDECMAVKALTSTGYSSALRLSHYPSIETSSLLKEEVGRMSVHADWVLVCMMVILRKHADNLSLFTLLLQDNAGGLEFQNQYTGEFMPAEPSEGLIFLNVGDMLMRLSNGVYPSAPHRVTAPAYIKQASGDIPEMIPERYSMPFFFWPHQEMVVAPMKSCISVENPAKYEPIKVDDYVQPMAKHLFEIQTE